MFADEPTEVFAATANNGEIQSNLRNDGCHHALPERRPGELQLQFWHSRNRMLHVIGTKGLLEANPAYEYSKVVKLRVAADEKTTKRVF
jgi:hypothetical protein